MAEVPTSSEADQAHLAEERWYLNDQREFLLRSIADARAEHDAGDLTDEDFSLLLARDQRRLSDVEADLGRLGPVGVAEVPDSSASADPHLSADPPPSAQPSSPASLSPASSSTSSSSPPAPPVATHRRSPWRIAGMVACSALIVLGIVILLVHALNPRLPGQSTSGGVTQTQAQLIEQQLEQATTDSDQGQFTGALRLYDKVLAEDPNDPDALAGSGWLEWSAGSSARSRSLMSDGRQAEEKTIRLEPSYFGAHLYLGLILLYQDQNYRAAASQFTDFLNDGAPASVVEKAAAPMKEAYAKAGLPVPAALAKTSG